MATLGSGTLVLSVGGLLLGLVLGTLMARRRRRLKVDWRLVVETDEGERSYGTDPPPPPPEPEP